MARQSIKPKRTYCAELVVCLTGAVTVLSAARGPAYARMEPDDIRIDLEFDDPNLTAAMGAKAEAALKPYFAAGRASPEAKGSSASARVRAIAQALLGPAWARPRGYTPSESNVQSINAAVAEFVAAGEPIEGVTFWGGGRNYGQRGFAPLPPGPPELADVIALRRYEQIHQAVRAAGYEPGVKPRVVMEDLGRLYMGGHTPEMRRLVREYKDGLRQLVPIVAPHVAFQPESEIIASRLVPEQARQLLGLAPGTTGSDQIYDELARLVEGRVFAYLQASETIAPRQAEDVAGYARVSGLPELKALEATGFKGGIPLNQRDALRKSTMKRLGYPAGLSASELDQHVAKYLAQGWARALLELRRGATVVEGKALAPLSFSFLPYPAGSPSNLDVRRVEWKAASGRMTGATPAWGGDGVLVRRGSRFQAEIDPYLEYPRAAQRAPFTATFTRAESGASARVRGSVRDARIR